MPRRTTTAPWRPPSHRRHGRGHATRDPSSQPGDGACGRCGFWRRHRHAPPCCRGLHGLRRNDRGRGVRMTPQASTHLVTERIVEPEPGAILSPRAPGRIGRLPMRPIVWHQAPGAAAPPPLLTAIHDLAHGGCAGAPTRLFGRQEGFQKLPRVGGDIRGVGQAPG
jgi:hypothetical protein